MNANQNIEIRLINSNGRSLHIADVIVDLSFSCRGHYRYSFRVGATNEQGHLRVSYHNVELLRREQAQIFLMDFNTKLEDCDPRVRIRLPSRNELERAHAYASAHYPDFAQRHAGPWLAAANGRVHAEDVEVDLAQETTEVEILCDLVDKGVG